MLGVLFPRVLVWLAGAAGVALMAFTRTYLGAHWLTDTIGGVLIGVCVALIIGAPFADRLFRERHRLPARPRTSAATAAPDEKRRKPRDR